MLTTEKAKRSHFIYLALLLLIAILGYWQIAFLKYSVTHDMINCWIPWRYYISQCFQNHIFPFWNPYQQLGYPIHADLQGPTWYIESILLSMTTGQTNYTLHFLFIFYVFLAGMGMYFLSLCFHSKRNVALLVGVCYMLGGFFVAHVQHFYAIIGAAWLPFIILNYYKMHTEKRYVRALYASIFMFFNLTGGNHTFSIILVYLCLFIFGYFIYESIKEKNKAAIYKLIKINLLFAVCTVILATVVIVAYSQTAPYIERLSGLTYKNASIFALSPQSLLSIIVPFSTVNSIDFFNTDPSMCNIYFGILMFVFVVLAFIKKKTTFEKVLLLFAVICLLASFGPYTKIHKLLFDSLPLINLFRNPSYFSLFSVLIFLLLGGKQLALFIDEREINTKKILRIVVLFFLSILLLLVVAFIKNHHQSFFFLNKFPTVFDFIKAASLKQNIVLQGCIQLLFLALMVVALTTLLKKHFLKIISLLIILDLFIAIQLNIAYVGFSQTSPKELHDYITSLPQDFPIPAKNNIIDNTEQMGQKHGLYRNTSIFHKRISADAFNSYDFKNQGLLIDSFPFLYKSMLTNKLVYLSNTIYPEALIHTLDTNSITHKTLIFSNKDFVKLNKLVGAHEFSLMEEKINLTDFNPTEIKIVAVSGKNQLITLLQSFYTGWEASIDGKQTAIFVTNYLTMSVVIPKGEHKIIFKYKNPTIVIAAIVSYTTFFILLVFLSVFWWRSNQNKFAVVLILGTIAFSVTYYFF